MGPRAMFSPVGLGALKGGSLRRLLPALSPTPYFLYLPEWRKGLKGVSEAVPEDPSAARNSREIKMMSVRCRSVVVRLIGRDDAWKAAPRSAG